VKTVGFRSLRENSCYFVDRSLTKEDTIHEITRILTKEPFATEYFARLRQADNEMKLAEIYNHVRLESGLLRRRDAGAQVPSLNGLLFGRSF
jgi:hypothetical protein